MTQALPHVSLDSSRLVRFLTDLSVSQEQVSHRHFSDRLGQLIDFSDAIALSEAHTRAPEIGNEDISTFRDGVTDEFLRARSMIVQAAMRSFFPGPGPVRIRWPAIENQPPADAAVACLTYLKFYRTQQGDVGGKVRSLHQRTRESVAVLSPRLARIADLDRALSDALSIHSQRYLQAIPRLLERRVEYLHKQFLESVERGMESDSAWEDAREQLRREIQGLLLAEIEVRLLPALGLIEALNEETPDED